MKEVPPHPDPADGDGVPPLWIFEDRHGRFGPLTDLRPAFALLAGGRTLRDRVQERLGRPASTLFVPAALAAVVSEREAGGAAVNPDAAAASSAVGGGDRTVLLVNGRWDGLDGPLAARLLALRPGEAVVDGAGVVVGVAGPAAALAAWAAGGAGGLPPGGAGAGGPAGGVLIDRPWGLLDRLTLGLAVDADAWAAGHAAGPLAFEHADGGEGVHLHPGARVHPTAVLDGSSGPVVVEAGADVQPFVFVQGPAWIGRGSVLAAHAQVRGPAAIGPGCKVGGEVKHLIFGSHSNKAHGGYLGDAVVGSWCNLGAGTTASNLKNTYGSVRVKLAADAEREDAGRSNQGPVVGDFVKTAIGTRLPTGCVVGTGACLAGSAIATSFVPRMTFTTDAGVAAAREDDFLRSVDRQLARRGRALGPALRARLRELLGGSEAAA